MVSGAALGDVQVRASFNGPFEEKFTDAEFTRYRVVPTAPKTDV